MSPSWKETELPQDFGANGDQVHSHQNKTILDEVGKGSGDKVLYNDGTFKTVSVGGAILNVDGGNASTIFSPESPVIDGGTA